MPVQLFNLRGVPEEEAEELRELLRAGAIDFYETPPGNWGISLPAIWLRDADRLAEARQLVADYQRERAARVRREYEALRREGKHRTIAHTLREHPLRVVAYLAIVALVIYVSVMPFLDLAQTQP